MKRLVGSIALAALYACAAGEGDESATIDAELSAEIASFFGDDRVGAALRGKVDGYPTNLSEVEALFGVGRNCVRPLSKEIFVIEESRSRLPNGEVTVEGDLLPRAVISGCNTGDHSDPSGVNLSTSLFVALISDPERAERTGGDGILTEPVEVMARDETTGIYNFYVFERNADGKAMVTRFFRDADDVVWERRLVAGGRVSQAVRPDGNSQRCFSCHVNGAPLMNELRDPWTNWVSFKKEMPLSSLSGETKELVSEAIPNGITHRASLANDLEPIMRAAIRSHIVGLYGSTGWARTTFDRPDGPRRLLRSVFCETTLNYATATDAIPFEVYFDPDLLNGDQIAPDAYDSFPMQLPIRSDEDRMIEGWLVDHGYLTHDLALAVRLFDDESDIFSDARCSMLDGAVSAIGEERQPAEFQQKVREFLRERAAEASFAETHPKRLEFLRALLEDEVDFSRVDEAHAEYMTELDERFEEMKEDYSRIQTRDRERKERARAMFPGTSSPLPVLP